MRYSLLIFLLFPLEALAVNDLWRCGSTYTDTPTVTEDSSCDQTDISSSAYTAIPEASFQQMSQARIKELKTDYLNKKKPVEGNGLFISWIAKDVDNLHGERGCILVGQLRTKEKMSISMTLINSHTSRKSVTMITKSYLKPTNWDAHFSSECNSLNIELSLLGKVKKRSQ